MESVLDQAFILFIQKNLFLEDGIQYMRENGIKRRVSRTHETELVSFKGFKTHPKGLWNTSPSWGCPFKNKKESRYAVSIFHKLIIITYKLLYYYIIILLYIIMHQINTIFYLLFYHCGMFSFFFIQPHSFCPTIFARIFANFLTSAARRHALKWAWKWGWGQVCKMSPIICKFCPVDSH